MIDNNKMDSREELLYSMSEIDDKYIMEAEGKQHFRRSGFFADPRRRTFLKTAAAVLAFFILAVPVGKVIRSSMQDPESQEYAKVTSAASNEADMEMANGQDPQSGAGETGMGGPVAGGIYTSGGIPIAGQEKSGDQSAGTDNNKGLVLDQAVLEKVLGTELAGLRLGMTESEVLAIVGKPDSRSEYQGTKAGIQSSGDAGLNGFKTGSGASSSASAIAVHGMVTWFYDADQEDGDLMTKMSLGMAYDHGEWILNSIHVYSPRYSLDNGIHPGSSLSDVEKACPDYVHTADAPVTDTYENEAPDMIRSETFTYGTRESGYEGTYIVIYLEDEIVSSVSMEYYFRDLASFDDEYSDE
ncbi:MAG: hypothetical protein II627_00590, partial [Lachnospiraceae bacterium]|nr:hypothetical protein [Lachnospiraceae bacterium]